MFIWWIPSPIIGRSCAGSTNHRWWRPSDCINFPFPVRLNPASCKALAIPSHSSGSQHMMNLISREPGTAWSFLWKKNSSGNANCSNTAQLINDPVKKTWCNPFSFNGSSLACMRPFRGRLLSLVLGDGSSGNTRYDLTFGGINPRLKCKVLPPFRSNVQ